MEVLLRPARITCHQYDRVNVWNSLPIASMSTPYLPAYCIGLRAITKWTTGYRHFPQDWNPRELPAKLMASKEFQDFLNAQGSISSHQDTSIVHSRCRACGVSAMARHLQTFPRGDPHRRCRNAGALGGTATLPSRHSFSRRG